MPKKKKTTQKESGGVLKFAAAVVGALAVGYYLHGPKGKERRQNIKAWTIKAKGDVLEQFEKKKELTEEQYREVIDKVTAKYGKLKTVGQTEAEKLNKELKKHWKEIKKGIETQSSKKK